MSPDTFDVLHDALLGAGFSINPRQLVSCEALINPGRSYRSLFTAAPLLQRLREDCKPLEQLHEEALAMNARRPRVVVVQEARGFTDAESIVLSTPYSMSATAAITGTSIVVAAAKALRAMTPSTANMRETCPRCHKTFILGTHRKCKR